jgi:hypothetical protein
MSDMTALCNGDKHFRLFATALLHKDQSMILSIAKYSRKKILLAATAGKKNSIR